MSWVWSEPLWLGVWLLTLPMGVLAWRWFTSMSRMRRVSAVVLRAVLLALLAGAVAGLSWSQRVDTVSVIGVVDVSESVRRFAHVEGGVPVEQAVGSYLSRVFRERATDDTMGLIVVDGDAAAVALPTTNDPTGRGLVGTGSDGTDLASGLRLAGAVAPRGSTPRVVLFSDGNQTTGDALAAVREMGSGGGPGVRVDVVPLTYRVGREVAVESVEAPPLAGEESTVTLRVVLRSTGRASGELSVLLGGDPVDANGADAGFARAVALEPGRTVVRVPVTLGPGRVHRFEAVFEPYPDGRGDPTDTSLANNRGESFTITPGRGRVLLASSTETRDVLAGALRGVGIEVDEAPVTGLPVEMLELQGYDAVLLENAAVEDVLDEQLSLLGEWVRRFGGGLVVIGGPDAFGSGGWRDSRLAELLPVELELPVREVRPSTAVVFVIDKSGSMGHRVLGSRRTQQEIANEATVLAIDVLDETDLVGVIAFSDREREIVELGRNDEPDRTSGAVRSIMAGGATNLPPALRLAVQRLEAADARDRQIVVLTDGQSENSEQLLPIATGLPGRQIRLTTIAIGDDADTDLLRQMAEAGGGAFYRVSRPEALPQVLVKAVRVERTPLVREEPFTPLVADSTSPLIAGFEGLPELGGLSLTSRRRLPTISTALVTPQGEPVLADWPVELGRVVAFTSDTGRWADEWARSPVYAQFWAQLVRTVSRADERGGGELDVESDGRVVRLTYRARTAEGVPVDRLSPTARLYGPSGARADATLVQRGPGEYAAEVVVPSEGAWIAVASATDGERALAPAFGGATVRGGGELAALESDEGLLRAIADATGGRVLSLDDPDGAALYDRATIVPRIDVQTVWPALVAWAIAVFVLDVGTRKVAWDRAISSEFGMGLARRAREAVASRGATATATVGGLRAGREEGQSLASRLRAGSVGGSSEDMVEQTERETRRARAESRLQEAARKREERRAKAPDTDPGEPSAGDRPSKPPEGESAGGESGLLAAKRRARERFKEQE
ncbi:MAG: VWA domain-containing protein [Phycisphaerales bacterium JB040]